MAGRVELGGAQVILANVAECACANGLALVDGDKAIHYDQPSKEEQEYIHRYPQGLLPIMGTQQSPMHQ